MLELSLMLTKTDLNRSDRSNRLFLQFLQKGYVNCFCNYHLWQTNMSNLRYLDRYLIIMSSGIQRHHVPVS